MELFRQWILGIVVCAMLAAAAEEIARGSAVSEVLRFCGGLVLLICIFQPLGTLIDIPNESAVFFQKAEIEELRQEYQAVRQGATEKSIAERTEAYIVTQAEELGLMLHAEVKVKESGGLLVPYAVYLDAVEHEPLAAWIAAELVIPRERQYWEEKG